MIIRALVLSGACPLPVAFLKSGHLAEWYSLSSLPPTHTLFTVAIRYWAKATWCYSMTCLQMGIGLGKASHSEQD